MAPPKKLKQTPSAEYDASKIKELPFPECVRKRPGMYVGNLDGNGNLTCLREIVNNSVDEHLRGFCNKINVVRYDDNKFMVSDNGRGVPFDKHESGKNVLEVIFGALHAGRNFDDEVKTEYTTGLNGIGASAVNAVSEYFQVQTRRDTKSAHITFGKGLVQEVKTYKTGNGVKGYKTGTTVSFSLDTTLFEGYATEEQVIKLLKETAYLNNGLEVTYMAPGAKKPEVYKYENGGEEFLLDYLNQDNLIIKPFSFSETINNVIVNIAMTYTNEFTTEVLHSFCNTIRTGDHGVHVTGFKRAVSQYVTDYIKVNKLSKEVITNEDVFIGLNAMISVFVFNPKYDGQTKSKLDNTEVNGFVFKAAGNGIKAWLDRNPKLAKILADKFSLAAKARIASKRAIDNVKRDSASMLSSLNSISKFADCIDNGTNYDCELWIVEGGSASGTIKEGRDRNYQAVYELKGKPLSALNVGLEKVYNNKELADLIAVLKCGVGDTCDISKMKFKKIVIAADADDDGEPHIRTTKELV